MGTVAPNRGDVNHRRAPGALRRQGQTALRGWAERVGDLRLNVGLRRLVTKFATPVVLLVGLLLLAAVHFRGVLAITTAQTDLYRGVSAYSSGPFQLSFQQNAGTQRPAVVFENAEILNYAEWSSTISVDGHVTNLWDNAHGYSADSSHRQVFSTISGPGWQVVEVAQLVDAHTITVQFEFVARNQGTAAPHNVTLSILHVHRSLYQPTLHGDRLTADVLPSPVTSLDGGAALASVGSLTFAVSGSAATGNDITLNNVVSAAGPNGASRAVTDSFTTTYSLSNPTVDKLTTLATETITFNGQAQPGQPAGVPVPLATPQQ